jgi:hypothetical protein
MTPAPSLQELIESVHADAPSEDALNQLAQASRTAAGLEEVGDALLGHFVDQSRRSGRSWSQISAALGVSKQAAHKRFSFDASTFEAGSPTFERFTPRARAVLDGAAEQATKRRHEQIETEDLLLALFEPSSSLAAEVLLTAGITRETCEKQLPGEDAGSAADEATGRRPFGLQVKHVIRSAVEEALRLRHNYIGTEHLILGLYHDPEDDAAKALVALGLSYDDAKHRLVEALDNHRAAG